jgi:type IV secretion system protein VirB10
MQRAPELEALTEADESAVRDKGARRNQYLGMGLLLAGGMIAAYMVLGNQGPTPRDMLDGEEDFQTTTFRPPGFVREGEEPAAVPDDNVVELPVPPPVEVPDTTQFDVPPPPPLIVQATPSPEIEPEVVEEFPDRYRSAMVVFDQSNAVSGQPGSTIAEADGAPLVAGQDRNSKFLASASAIGDRSANASQLARIDALVPEGTLIPGILETAVNSDLPGQMRAIVSDDVYSFDGRRVLIPTGTRLIGEYQSEVTRGQQRIFVVWTRLIRDDGVSVRLNSIGADSLGRAGITGFVDERFRERFGSAILLSVVGAGASYLTGFGSDQAFGDQNDDAQRGEELARQTIAETMSDIANDVLADSLNIPPTISVPQGERIFVYVRQDLDFSAMYDDPVTEALQEIKRERGLQ